MNETPILLASGSPRRRELLQLGGVHFQVMTRPTDETLPDSIAPWEAVLFLARQKGSAVREACPHQAVLSADTVVALEGRILENPGTNSRPNRCSPSCREKRTRCIPGFACSTDSRSMCFMKKPMSRFGR